MNKRTKVKESATRKKIDILLNNLEWDTDEESPYCNICTERLKTTEQQNKLKGKEPDYSLYKYGTDEIIGIIEAKRKGKDLNETLKDAIEKYAKPLDIPIVFVSDGTFFKTWHIKDNKELTVDGEPVNELLKEKMILRFINEGSEIESIVSKEIKYTREQLVSVFKWANDLLRKEGIREGFDRFIEFANLLFLKLISEMEIDREKNGEDRILDKKFCWEDFSNLPPDTMMEYINGTVLPHLVGRYNKSGDVFQNKLGITNSLTLKQIVDKLSRLTLINIESDIKGDAFEYFLKNAVTVGNDLGEYFTPRHIVRLMVKLVSPQFGDTVYDPTCGTGGFLIDAFRHIKKSCKQTKENLKILQEKTVFGRELTNTARIAKMNMILTGDGHTNIEQMDCLQKPVKNLYDVVLANPPYGQNTDWGNLYPVHSNNADCIFIQHVMLSLNENGRACIIVPEGFLFRTGVDKKTRKYMIDNFNLIAVISLPSGVFNPYTGSKTDILVFEKGKTKKIWFYELSNDGFDLGATRKPISENDIPDLIKKWEEKPNSENSWTVENHIIAENDYILTVGKYRDINKVQIESKYKSIELGNESYFKIIGGGTPSRNNPDYFNGKYLWFTPSDLTRMKNLYIQDSKEKISIEAIQSSSAKIVPKNSVLLTTRATIGEVKICKKEFTTNQGIKSFACNENKILPEFLAYCLIGLKRELINNANKTTFLEINKTNLMKLKIPVPPIDIQKKYVDRLNKQKMVMDDAEKVIDSIKNAGFDRKYFFGNNKKISDVIDISKEKIEPTDFPKTLFNYIGLENIESGTGKLVDYSLTWGKDISSKKSKFTREDILYGKLRPYLNKIFLPSFDGICSTDFLVFKPKKNIIIKEYLSYFLLSPSFVDIATKKMAGTTLPRIKPVDFKNIAIPVPSIEIQIVLVQSMNKSMEAIESMINLKDESENMIRTIIDEIFSPKGNGWYPIDRQKKLEV